MVKKIYLKDIAKDLNLSKTTVSLVLNGRGDENNINKDTQVRILDYARKVKYVPNQLARGLSTGKTWSIGLIVPDISNNFYAEIAGFVEKEAESHGYNVVFSSAHENPETEAKLIHSMINRQMDGLILASTQHNSKELVTLKKMGYPFVLIDRHYPELKLRSVVVDNFKGIQKATEHLIDQGREKIAFVTVDLNLEAIYQRKLGYQQALENSNLEPDQNLIVELTFGNYKNEMKKALNRLAGGVDKVDAIIFSTNYLTRVGLRELKKMGISIPHEIALISFDEFSAFDLVDPPITAIKQPVEQIGKKAVGILLDEIDRKKSTDQQIVLDTELLIRESCGSKLVN